MKKFSNKYFLLIILASCNFSSSKKVYTSADCDTLSMSCYMGKPNDCYELKNSCQNIEYKYTKELCQDAFNKLMVGFKKDQLQLSYGERIIECFTQDQIDKYL